MLPTFLNSRERGATDDPIQLSKSYRNSLPLFSPIRLRSQRSMRPTDHVDRTSPWSRRPEYRSPQSSSSATAQRGLHDLVQPDELRQPLLPEGRLKVSLRFASCVSAEAPPGGASGGRRISGAARDGWSHHGATPVKRNRVSELPGIVRRSGVASDCLERVLGIEVLCSSECRIFVNTGIRYCAD